ncbi:MAG: UDP-N-acetylmuramate dehydrogenase [Candidatus Delongbacteria bacterium]
MSTPRAIERLRDAFPERCTPDAPLTALSTWRIGGPAALLFTPESEAELAAGLALLRAEDAAWWLVGGGSNLLFPDEGLAGVVLHPGPGLAWLEVDAPLLRAGAATSAVVLCRRAAQAGLAGLEFAGGIPGTVGGMVRMNAGAHGQELAQSLVRVRLLDPDGAIGWVDAAELRLEYRSSPGLGARLVLAAEFRLRADDPEAIKLRLRELLERRRATQPLQEASCGSVFKRPAGDFPGRLIEAAGLKGARVGAAVVSQIHANFFVNEGGASAADIVALVELVKRTVRERFGVELEEEFQHVR